MVLAQEREHLPGPLGHGHADLLHSHHAHLALAICECGFPHVGERAPAQLAAQLQLRFLDQRLRPKHLRVVIDVHLHLGRSSRACSQLRNCNG